MARGLTISFEAWMREVDRAVLAAIGCSVHDLPDCLFRDWYDDGIKPASAARKAIKNAKDEM